MRIHRSARTRFFTTIGNDVLRDNRLSFCARGVLGHLLSLPDGQPGDILTLTARTPEGRKRVSTALAELERLGYLTRKVKRNAQGRLYTEVDVFDTPGGTALQATPHADLPDAGREVVSPDGDHPVNERKKEPTHPTPPAEDELQGREGDVDQETRASAELLARVARTEPRLLLGRREALRLAPLVTEWRRRGTSDLHVVGALTAGLPSGGVHHPARFLETRLRTKMPAEPTTAPARPECDACRTPVPVVGSCRSCRDVKPAGPRALTDFAQVRTRGVALARAALRGLAIDDTAPAPA